MNGRERYDATLRGEPVDHLARIPILMQRAAEHIGASYGNYAADWRVLTAAHLRSAADFGLDLLSVMSDPYRECSAFGGEVEFPPAGPKCPRPPLAAARDLALLAHPDPATSPRLASCLAAIRRFRDEGRGAYSILGWVEGPAAEAADLRGVTDFLLDLHDDPAFAGALMDRCMEAGIAFAAAQIAAGADTIGIGDAIASQISPRMYERLVLPRERVLAAAIRARGARVRMHICGNIAHLLPGLASLPLDILDVDHLVDLAAVRARIPPPVALAGNLDPVAEVRHGTPESIRAGVLRCYETAGNPYLVNAGCEIPPGTPDANLHALCAPIPSRA
ncbi:MAG: uroporphyrinogen decarboxylase family protein [Planctomycetota bacterium]